MGLTIDELHLSRNAYRGAKIVLAAHPEAIFTSGRRDPRDQARVMAVNVIRHGTAWLTDTYRDQRMAKMLASWTEENPEQAETVLTLSNGYYDLLLECYSGQLAEKFPHLRGDAFDIAWPMLGNGLINRPKGEAICKTIETLPSELGMHLLLRREGKHDVIHAQFDHRVDV